MKNNPPLAPPPVDRLQLTVTALHEGLQPSIPIGCFGCCILCFTEEE